MKVKIIFVSSLFTVLFLNCILSFENPSEAAWKKVAIDDPKSFYSFCPRAIAIDKGNRPHIAYGGDHLYYAYYNGKKWIYKTLDFSPGVGSYASLAIDASQNIHISYYDSVK